MTEQKNNISIKFDADGMPCESTLEEIRKYVPEKGWDPQGEELDKFMYQIQQMWHWPHLCKKEEKIWLLSTGGWSGNEMIIAALKDNDLFWLLYAIAWRRGGHYIFGTSAGCVNFTYSTF